MILNNYKTVLRRKVKATSKFDILQIKLFALVSSEQKRRNRKIWRKIIARCFQMPLLQVYFEYLLIIPLLSASCLIVRLHT